MTSGYDKMRSGGMSLVSFNHVIDPHYVTFSSSLYVTTRDPNPNRNPTVGSRMGMRTAVKPR